MTISEAELKGSRLCGTYTSPESTLCLFCFRINWPGTEKPLST